MVQNPRSDGSAEPASSAATISLLGKWEGKMGLEIRKNTCLLSLHVGGRWNRKEIMLREFYPLCALDDLVIRLVLCLLLLT